jgi:hypothetical protein
MIKLRFDVDYAYSSRIKSFLNIAGFKPKTWNYLNNAKIIADMINKSKEQVLAYWFFTPYTLPDQKLLELLNSERHEIGLHVVNNPLKELKQLEKVTGKKIKYYTIHGTIKLCTQLLWGRSFGQTQTVIPKDYPLLSLHLEPTISLDSACYNSNSVVFNQNCILAMHPEWLFCSNGKNRGPFFEELKRILEVESHSNLKVTTFKEVIL